MELSAVGERVFAAEALLKRRIRKVGVPPGRPRAPSPAPRPPPASRPRRRCGGPAGPGPVAAGRPLGAALSPRRMPGRSPPAGRVSALCLPARRAAHPLRVSKKSL